MVAGVVLAAGRGGRLGVPKALVRLEGELLVERVTGEMVAAGCEPVVVVLGAAAGTIRERACLPGAETVHNDRWRSGMGSSLTVGLAALAGRADAAGITLVDQPGITAAAIRRVADAWEDSDRPAATATFTGAQRPPVVLGAAVWDDVTAAAVGDRGARAWLRAHPGEVREVPCDDIADPADIDIPADLDRYGAVTPPVG